MRLPVPRLLTGIVVALVSLSGAGLAAADPFTVSRVAVDERGETTTEAQQRAFAAGQARAANRLVARLTLAEDRQSYGVGQVSAADAQSMIMGLQVSDEQRSAQRYIAHLTVDFDPREARAWLRRSGIPFVEAQARPVLAIPVVQDAAGNEIWDTRWQRAWMQSGFEHELTPFIAIGSADGPDGEPLGGSLTASQALSLNEAALREAARAYGVQAVAVIAARPRDGGFSSTGIILDFSQSRTERVDLASLNAGDEAGLARAVVEAHQEAWKRETVVRDGGSSSMRLTFLFDTLGEWRSLQSAVTGASLVQNARLDAVSRTGAVMTVTHRGDREQLARELAQRGARLEEADRMGWTIRGRN